MSTLSSATASGRDQVPSDDPHLKAKMCMFIVMWKDGTSFDATSVLEEDILEICVALVHTHPLGVLWYLAMESVALFYMTEEMQWASCSAVKAMELWDEPITIWVVAPLEHHIEVYIAIVGGDHSKLWSLPSEGEGDPHSPTGNPHLDGNTLHLLQAELGDLVDQELWQLVVDLHQEIALHELHAPPSNPQPTPWEECSGSSKTNGNDQEVIFLRGEGGFPQDNHPHLQLQHNQVEGGFIRNHLLSPQGLLWQI